MTDTTEASTIAAIALALSGIRVVRDWWGQR